MATAPYTENPEYVQTLIDLINKARADVGRAALTVNAQLTAAARAAQPGHGLQQLYEAQRLGRLLDRRPGNGRRLYQSLLFGNPRHRASTGCHESMAHRKDDWSAVLNSRVTEIGVGYVFSKFSAYGGYWTVVMGGSSHW